jgi:hypothetical protein
LETFDYALKDMFKFNREKLIKFYDVKLKEPGHGAHVTAITSLWGEDLLFGLLRHYWLHKENCKSKILRYICTTGKKKGPRLDAWILKTKPNNGQTLFQVEVKNWSAYSIGGETLKFDASKEELRKFAEEYWLYWFEGKSLPIKVAKVIETMIKPENHTHLTATPLLCFWFYICDKQGKPYRIKTYDNGKQVHVFSASAYLRSLTMATIDIEMPRAERRLGLMKEVGWLGKT